MEFLLKTSNSLKPGTLELGVYGTVTQLYPPYGAMVTSSKATEYSVSNVLEMLCINFVQNYLFTIVLTVSHCTIVYADFIPFLSQK